MKKTARNDVTGDWLQSKPNNEQGKKFYPSMNLINQQAKSKR
jgi:hypothetical protein